MKKRILTLALGGIVAVGVAVGSYGLTNAKVFAADTNSVAKSAVVAEKVDKEDQENINLSKLNVKISKEEAKIIALSSQKDGKVLNVELENEDGTIVYGVELQTPQKNYDIKIDANTGKILKSEVDDEKEGSSTDEENQNINDDDNNNINEAIEE
ncbi:PepSY domain-containing protein [Microaerobacter geothermalis]|nr:PepSY domain-containing protein [Microaerobacter geothermalis]